MTSDHILMCVKLIRNAEARLGTLSDGERIDLILDNDVEFFQASVEVREILPEIARILSDSNAPK